MVTPSETLLAAADRIRDRPELVTPNLAPLLADWLETEVACIASVDDVQRIVPKILDNIEPVGVDTAEMTVTIDTSGAALAFRSGDLGVGGGYPLSTDPTWVPGDPIYPNEVDRRWCTHCLNGWTGGPVACPGCGLDSVEGCPSCGARDGCPACINPPEESR